LGLFNLILGHSPNLGGQLFKFNEYLLFFGSPKIIDHFREGKGVVDEAKKERVIELFLFLVQVISR
jgi:hypothetical protein